MLHAGDVEVIRIEEMLALEPASVFAFKHGA